VRYRRGVCRKHWRMARSTGKLGRRDPGPAREHLLKLRALGWTHPQIAAAAVVSRKVVEGLERGTTTYVLVESERAILSVPLVSRESRRGTDGTGTWRRYEALQWMGWPVTKIAAEVGVKPSTLSTMRARRGAVSHRVARAMAALYERWSATPGPSQRTATKARKRGYASPWAWDDETIDDPAAAPQGVEAEQVTGKDRYLDARAIGCTRQEAARRAGISLNTARDIDRRLAGVV